MRRSTFFRLGMAAVAILIASVFVVNALGPRSTASAKVADPADSQGALQADNPQPELQATATPGVPPAVSTQEAVIADDPAKAAIAPVDKAFWLGAQTFDASVNACDPQTYLGWTEQDSRITGTTPDLYDYVLDQGQEGAAWGTNVVVDETSYGLGKIYFVGPGRWQLQITNGAYVVGVDGWGFFSTYLNKVLECSSPHLAAMTEVGPQSAPAMALATSINPVDNPSGWLAAQSFLAPVCDPKSYLGWVEHDFVPTGGHTDEYNADNVQVFALVDKEKSALWGGNVKVNDTDFGRGLVILSEPGNYNVSITDGAYRVGEDAWGVFPQYWGNVLTCLYGGDFTPQMYP